MSNAWPRYDGDYFLIVYSRKFTDNVDTARYQLYASKSLNHVAAACILETDCKSEMLLKMAVYGLKLGKLFGKGKLLYDELHALHAGYACLEVLDVRNADGRA